MTLLYSLQGLRSANKEMATFCSSALLHCETFLHPRTSAQLLLRLDEMPLPAAEVLRSSLLKEPMSSGGGAARAVASAAGA